MAGTFSGDVDSVAAARTKLYSHADDLTARANGIEAVGQGVAASSAGLGTQALVKSTQDLCTALRAAATQCRNIADTTNAGMNKIAAGDQDSATTIGRAVGSGLNLSF